MKIKKIESLERCPECGISWVGAEIPKQYRHQYSSNNGHFSRLIGVETGAYDGVSFWECPDCKTQWDRWTNKKMDVEKNLLDKDE